MAKILNDNYKKKKFAVLTFDDGYTDSFDVIYPIFKKYQLPFGVYVVTDFPDRETILWWYMLEDLVLKLPIIFFHI